MSKITRSPNYPKISFSEAIEKAKLIYKSAHQHTISDEEIAAALNYTSLNGRSMTVISAIKKYGLLEPAGDGFRISEDAFNIFELPPESKEYIESLKKMAYSPQIFVELKETYGDSLPSDQILRHYLIKNKFNPNTADELIRNYHDTIDLVTQAEERYNANMKPTALQPAQVLPPEARNQQHYTKPYIGHQTLYRMADESDRNEEEIAKELRFALSDNVEVRLLFKGNPTNKSVRKLIKLLEITFDLTDETTKEPIQQSLLDIVTPKQRRFNLEEDDPVSTAEFSRE
jgi:hypothetical protein